MPTHAIIVSVPPPEELVFLVMPFSDQFDNVRLAVERAATFCRLTPLRADTCPGHTFTADIRLLTQKARLIVAVCTPESTSGRCNANVMYELGLAQGIGKATVILTTDIDSLPSDIRCQHALQYDPKDPVSVLTDHISARMHHVLGRVTNHFTDSEYADVSATSSHHGLHLKPDLWDSYIVILTAAKKAHNLYQELDTAHIDILTKRLDVIPGHGTTDCPDPATVAFRAAWQAYTLKCEDVDTDHFDEDWERKTIDSALGHLATSDLLSKDLFNRIFRFQKELRTAVDTYKKKDREAKDLVHRWATVTQLFASADLTTFRGHLEQLQQASKKVLLYADKLILNLIDAVAVSTPRV